MAKPDQVLELASYDDVAAPATARPSISQAISLKRIADTLDELAPFIMAGPAVFGANAGTVRTSERMAKIAGDAVNIQSAELSEMTIGDTKKLIRSLAGEVLRNRAPDPDPTNMTVTELQQAAERPRRPATPAKQAERPKPRRNR